MIQSMTGYGKSTIAVSGRNLIIEIKTLNSKQLDLNLKLPQFLRETEPVIRNLVNQMLERGKVDFIFTLDTENEVIASSMNRKLVKIYHDEIISVCRSTGIPEPQDILSVIMKMPEIYSGTQESVSEEETQNFIGCVSDLLEQVCEFRKNEGKTLENDILMHIHTILELLDAIIPFEKQRVNSIRDRLTREFEKYSNENSGASLDQNRFEQELIFYFEKLDINEEKVRLWKHCGYFLETLKENGNQGKKLGFIVQEMGREINTIGSKANDADIQRIVVQMKDELEKVKEQLGNVL